MACRLPIFSAGELNTIDKEKMVFCTSTSGYPIC